MDVPFTPYDKSWFDHPLIDVIGEIAHRLPNQIAVDDGAMRLTYSQLYAAACRLSQTIVQGSLPPGPIGIKLTYGVLHPVAMLGCLAAGRPCLLLSQDSPPDYNRRLIETSGIASLLVNEADTRKASAAVGPNLIPIEPALTSGRDFDDRPAGRLGPDEPAFIVSTSGSTGAPKLVVGSQRRLQRSASNNIDSGHFNRNDRFLNLGAVANGAAVLRCFAPLMIGATLHLVDMPRAGVGGALRILRTQRITVLRTTVSLMKALSELAETPEHLTSLRMVWVGGEVLLQKDLAQIRSILPPNCRLGYSLSMTETSVARWLVPENDDHDPVRVAVGYLPPETEVLVLDDEGRPCPPGVIGELIVRSGIVMLGEWADGHVISDRFQRDPTDPAKRIYRTGDMVRICPDGVMVVHGRKDRMIKIRGQRVEPAVIEMAIRNVAGVAHAAVAAKQIDGDFRIYGFVVPSAQAGGDLATDVKNALKTALPPSMHPSEIVIVESLPTTAAGKIDINSLLASISSDDRAVAPTAVGSVPSASDDLPSGKARDMIADAWRAAFRKGPRDASLSFEAAGGDSLQFMQIIFRLEQLSGGSLPLSAFDVSMTQHDMARRLDFLLDGGVEPQRPGKQVFLLPGVGGDEPRLLQFRAGCAPELSITCLEYGDWTQWVEPGFALDAIVNRLVAQIQELAPTDPLNLAGYSFGGWMAVVLAGRLHKAGREIENLLILDTAAIKPRDIEERDEIAVAKPLPTLRQEFEMVKWARRRGEGAFAIAEVVARRLVRPRCAPLLRWLARHRRRVLPGRIDFYLSFCINEQYLLLMSDWRRRIREIPRLPVPITVYRTGDMAANEDCKAGWTRLSSRVSVVPIGGNHFSMFEPPHLADLCVRFKSAASAKSSGGVSASPRNTVPVLLP